MTRLHLPHAVAVNFQVDVVGLKAETAVSVLPSMLFRHSAKSLIAKEERLATSPCFLVTRLHLPHVIVMGLHVRKVNVVTLTPEKVTAVGV